MERGRKIIILTINDSNMIEKKKKKKSKHSGFKTRDQENILNMSFAWVASLLHSDGLVRALVVRS